MGLLSLHHPSFLGSLLVLIVFEYSKAADNERGACNSIFCRERNLCKQEASISLRFSNIT